MSEAIRVECLKCQGIIHAPSDAGGKKGKCPTCGAMLAIPTPEPPEPVRTSPRPRFREVPAYSDPPAAWTAPRFVAPAAFLLGILAAALAGGCSRGDASSSPPPLAIAEGNAEPSGPVQASAVYDPPAPHRTKDTPPAVVAKSMNDSVTKTLNAMQENLKVTREAYLAKVAAQKDAKAQVAALRPIVQSNRSACIFMEIATEDLDHELQFAEANYRSAAKHWRERAKSLDGQPALVEMTLAASRELDALGDDVPRRRRLVATFQLQLAQHRKFLAQTAWALSDYEAAMEIVTAGPDPFTVSAEARDFAAQLDKFMDAVRTFHERFLHSPKQPREKSEGSEPPSSPPAEPSSPSFQPRTVQTMVKP